MAVAKPHNLKRVQVKEYFLNCFYYSIVGSMSPEPDKVRNNLIIYTPGEPQKHSEVESSWEQRNSFTYSDPSKRAINHCRC